MESKQKVGELDRNETQRRNNAKKHLYQMFAGRVDTDIIDMVFANCNYELEDATVSILSICGDNVASSQKDYSSYQDPKQKPFPTTSYVPVEQRHAVLPVETNQWETNNKGRPDSYQMDSAKMAGGAIPKRGQEKFAQWRTDASKQGHKPKLIIMRGLPGSGKSTIARSLKGPNGVILSTDDYFMRDNRYIFDPALLGKAHEWNQFKAKRAMEDGKNPVIIDNTNCRFWEMKPYVAMALRFRYDTQFRESMSPGAFHPRELARRNSHGVKEDAIKRMMERYERNPTVDKVLRAEMPERRQEDPSKNTSPKRLADAENFLHKSHSDGELGRHHFMTNVPQQHESVREKLPQGSGMHTWRESNVGRTPKGYWEERGCQPEKSRPTYGRRSPITMNYFGTNGDEGGKKRLSLEEQVDTIVIDDNYNDQGLSPRPQRSRKVRRKDLSQQANSIANVEGNPKSQDIPPRIESHPPDDEEEPADAWMDIEDVLEELVKPDRTKNTEMVIEAQNDTESGRGHPSRTGGMDSKDASEVFNHFVANLTSDGGGVHQDDHRQNIVCSINDSCTGGESEAPNDSITAEKKGTIENSGIDTEGHHGPHNSESSMSIPNDTVKFTAVPITCNNTNTPAIIDLTNLICTAPTCSLSSQTVSTVQSMDGTNTVITASLESCVNSTAQVTNNVCSDVTEESPGIRPTAALAGGAIGVSEHQRKDDEVDKPMEDYIILDSIPMDISDETSQDENDADDDTENTGTTSESTGVESDVPPCRANQSPQVSSPAQPNSSDIPLLDLTSESSVSANQYLCDELSFLLECFAYIDQDKISRAFDRNNQDVIKTCDELLKESCVDDVIRISDDDDDVNEIHCITLIDESDDATNTDDSQDCSIVRHGPIVPNQAAEGESGIHQSDNTPTFRPSGRIPDDSSIAQAHVPGIDNSSSAQSNQSTSLTAAFSSIISPMAGKNYGELFLCDRDDTDKNKDMLLVALDYRMAKELKNRFGEEDTFQIDPRDPEDFLFEVDESFGLELYKMWKNCIEKRRAEIQNLVKSDAEYAQRLQMEEERKRTTPKSSADTFPAVPGPSGVKEKATGPGLSLPGEEFRQKQKSPLHGSFKPWREIASGSGTSRQMAWNHLQSDSREQKRRRLYNMFPGLDENALDEILAAMNYNLETTINLVRASCGILNQKPKDVFASGEVVRSSTTIPASPKAGSSRENTSESRRGLNVGATIENALRARPRTHVTEKTRGNAGRNVDASSGSSVGFISVSSGEIPGSIVNASIGSSFGASESIVGASRSSVGGSGVSIEPSGSGVGTSESTVGAAGSSMGAFGSTVGTSGSSVGASRSSAGASRSSAGASRSSVEASRSSVEASRSSVGVSRSSVEASGSSVEDGSGSRPRSRSRTRGTDDIDIANTRRTSCGIYQEFSEPSYADFRGEAQIHANLRAECFKKAAKAHAEKNGRLALYYADQGRMHTEKMREAHSRAAALILQKKNENRNRQAVLDLHGLHVKEALEALEGFLYEAEHNSNQLCVEIITGRGNHSKGGIAKLKPVIIHRLVKLNYRIEPLNQGSIRVWLR